MEKRITSIGRRMGAWLLALVMVASLISVPAREVQAAETVTYDLLNGTAITETGTVAKDQYGPDVFCEHQFGDLDNTLLSSLGSYSSLVFEAEVTVNTCSAGNPTIVGYAMDASYKNWKDVGEETSSLPATKKITLDLTSYTTLSRVGIRFTQCEIGTSINYTIKSAKITGIKKDSSSEGDITGGETSGDVKAEITKKSGGTDWAEYSYSVTNGTESAISGIKIKVPYSGTVNNLQSWKCSATQSGGYIIISHTAVLKAGGSYTCDSDTKFGFAGGASLGTPVVEFVYGEDGGGTSSSELKYELTGKVKTLAESETPVGKHGALKLATVDGYSAPVIVDKSGKPFQLRGASTHGMHWNEMHPYVNKGSFQSLRDEWGVNMVRLVSYVTQGGYTQGSQSQLDEKIQTGVQAATELGMYVIIDWHIHAENPHTTKTNAEAFFKKYATMYKDYNNVIFEICNEPTGVEWYNGSGSDLYSYCKDIAGIIRNCGSKALIVCGTNTWSQDVDDVAKKPLKNDGFDNILYTFHFYSASHYSDKMGKVKTALAAGTPIFVTEFGVCSADGNGNFDTANADAWIKLCDDNNISYACWSLCNKSEAASYLSTSCTKTTGGWVESDLATTGKWLVNTYRAHEDAENGTDTSKGDFSISVDPAGGVLEDVATGYTDSGKAVITVKNTSEKDIEGLSGKLALGTNFEIVKNFSSTTLAAGGSTTMEVALKKGKAAGTYADTVTIQSGTIKKTQNVKQVVTAAPVAVTGVSLNKTTLELGKGESEKLTATIKPEDATNKKVTWTSSKEAVATVDATGKVTAVAPGEATITVTTKDGTHKATCTVTVSKKTLTSVTFPTVSKSVKAGVTLKDVALSKKSDDYGTFAWKNPATVVKGTMTGAEVVYTLKDSENVEIASTVEGVSADRTTVTRTVNFTVSKVTPTVTVPETVSVDAGTKLSEVLTKEFLGKCTSSVEGSFAWKETDKQLTYKDNHASYTLVFTPKDMDSYNKVEKTVTLNVTKKANSQKPVAPVLASKMAESVTLTAYAGEGTVQYGVKSGSGAYTWQDTPEFTMLSPYTTYTFAMRYAADDIYNASDAGEALTVTTYFEAADCLVVDLSKLTDKYVEAHNGTISYDSTTKTLSLLNEAVYTITGSNPDVTINCGKATVILQDTTFKKLTAGVDVVIKLDGNNVISEGITGSGIVALENAGGSSTGSLEVTGNSDKAAIEAGGIVINGGQITATGTGTNPALKSTGDIKLIGGSLTANAEENVIPITVEGNGKIVLDGCQVQSSATNIYSKDPVDAEGNSVSTHTVTYKDGETVLGTYNVKQGASITLKNLALKSGYKAEGWKVDGQSEVLKVGASVEVTGDITYIASYIKITGDMKVAAAETTSLEVGYTSDEGVEVTITNNTNVTIDKIALALDSDDHFRLNKNYISALAPGKSDTVSVILKNGMGVNEDGYTVTLTASCIETESKSVEITRKVVKKTATKPDKAPSVSKRTANSITLTPVEGAEYGIKDGDVYNWQAGNVFTGLDSYTAYTFVLRYKATENAQASPASEETIATTFMSEKDSYTVDVSELAEKPYVEAHNGTISVEGDILTLEKAGTYTVTGKNENLTIHAKEDVTIILDNAVIKNVTGDGDITLQLNGTSKIVSTQEEQSGVAVEGTLTLTTDKDKAGSVTIQGGDNAAGITAEEVVITGGTVDIQGGKDAAGIEAGTVTITGGTVGVTGQGDKPAIDADVKNIDVDVDIQDGGSYKEQEDDKKVESITIKIPSATMEEKSVATATVTVLPADAANKAVTWSSTNQSVATVSQSGVITAVAAGTTDIIATAKDGSGKSGKITLTVVKKKPADDGKVKASAMVVTANVKRVSKMAVKKTMKMAPKKTMTLKVAFSPANAVKETVTFKSSNPKVAAVNSKGKITAKKAGKTNITIISKNGLKKTFKLQVMKKAVSKIKIKASKKTIKVRKTVKLKAVTTPGKKLASTSVFWKSGNTKIATVSASGTVKGRKKGKVKITAYATDGSGKKATITIRVK